MTGDDVDYVMEKEYTVAEAAPETETQSSSSRQKEKAVKPVRGRKPGLRKPADKKRK
jgi:hypothetical protein